MNLLKLILLLFLSFSVNAQNIKIEFDVIMSKKFSKKGLEKFEKNMDKESKSFFIKKNQAPQKSSYINFLSKDISLIQYQEIINNSESENEKKFSFKVAPFGFGLSVRKLNHNQILIETKNLNKNIWGKKSLAKIEWLDKKQDSIILGYNVQKSIGIDKTTGFEYSVWYAKDLPKQLGVYNLNHPKGYILSFKAVVKNINPSIDFIKMEARPIAIKKLSKRQKKKFKSVYKKINNATILDMKEIQKMYQERNKASNIN